MTNSVGSQVASRDLWRVLLAGAVLSQLVGCVGEEASVAPGSRPTRVATSIVGNALRLGDSVPAFETVAASAGGVALDMAVLSSETGATGAVTTARASFMELLEPLSDGYEQSWRFDQPSGAEGDLTLTVDASALEHVSTTEEGLLLRRPGELEVRYGHGTWIDASGRQWRVPARHDRGRILLTVPATVRTISSYPAVLDPKIVVTPA